MYLEGTMNDLIAITKVCQLLNTTSRTLRFYEEKGLIHSTRAQFTELRHYSFEEVERIRKILILRSLNLSLGEIKEVLASKDLFETLNQKSRKLKAEGHELYKKHLLLKKLVSKPLASIADVRAEIENVVLNRNEMEEDKQRKDNALKASNALINLDYDSFYQLTNERLSKRITKDILSSFLDKFINDKDFTPYLIESIEDEDSILHIVQCKSCRLIISYSFYKDDKIIGLYFNDIE